MKQELSSVTQTLESVISNNGKIEEMETTLNDLRDNLTKEHEIFNTLELNPRSINTMLSEQKKKVNVRKLYRNR